jgi:hypothetical protein
MAAVINTGDRFWRISQDQVAGANRGFVHDGAG